MPIGYAIRHGGGAILDQGFDFHSDTVFQVTPAAETQLVTAALSAWWRLTERPASNHSLLGAYQNSTNLVTWYLDSSFRVFIRCVTAASTIVELVTTATYDTSAWHHGFVVLELDHATQGERARLYIDGTRVTAFDTETYPVDAAKEFRGLFQTERMHLGSDGVADNVAGQGWRGVLADVQVMDDVVPNVSELGQLVGSTWAWRDYVGSHGVNGGRYEFRDSADLGKNTRKL